MSNAGSTSGKMIEQLLTRRGFGYGSGIIKNDATKFIVNIPKNASSYMLDWCTKHVGWSSAVVGDSCDWDSVADVIVILRDPLDRWISGAAQYLTSYVLNVTGAYDWELGPGIHDQYMTADEFIQYYNPAVERLLFDQLSNLDDHVWPQVDFFKDLLINVPRTYFYMDNTLIEKLSKYLSLMPLTTVDKNSGLDNPETHKVQSFLKSRLTIRPELVEQVKKNYAQDYELINQVNFL